MSLGAGLGCMLRSLGGRELLRRQGVRCATGGTAVLTGRQRPSAGLPGLLLCLCLSVAVPCIVLLGLRLLSFWLRWAADGSASNMQHRQQLTCAVTSTLFGTWQDWHDPLLACRARTATRICCPSSRQRMRARYPSTSPSTSCQPCLCTGTGCCRPPRGRSSGARYIPSAA